MLAADLDFQKAHETCAGLPTRRRYKADVTKREDVEALLAQHDQIDVYFNNAGIPETVKPLAEITREEWDAVLDVNLTALFIAAQVAAPQAQGRRADRDRLDHRQPPARRASPRTSPPSPA